MVSAIDSDPSGKAVPSLVAKPMARWSLEGPPPAALDVVSRKIALQQLLDNVPRLEALEADTRSVQQARLSGSESMTTIRGDTPKSSVFGHAINDGTVALVRSIDQAACERRVAKAHGAVVVRPKRKRPAECSA